MKLRRYIIWLFLVLLVLESAGSCASAQKRSVPLASFTENDVAVVVSLERDSAGNYFLSGTFTPPEGYHLYSKDIPRHGIDGLGRPTLITLSTEGRLKVSGELIESVTPQEPDFEPKELLVYPAGAVTLSLPIQLPRKDQPVQEEIEVTYMACSANLCKPPVEDKIVQVQIPSTETLDNQ